jgi:hypothetical protein
MRHISLAAVLRNASTNETYPHAKLVAPFLVEDDEPPVSLVVGLLDERIQEGNSTSSWCLVSGYPRSKDQHCGYEMVSCNDFAKATLTLCRFRRTTTSCSSALRRRRRCTVAGILKKEISQKATLLKSAYLDIA